MIKGILFDKDGTLVEFQHTWHLIMDSVFQRMAKDFRLDDSAIRSLQTLSGYTVEGFVQESMIQYLSTREIVGKWIDVLGQRGYTAVSGKRLLSVFEETSLKITSPEILLPGVKETLNYLSGNNYILGVATADTTASAVAGLRRTDLLHYFSYIGSDDGLIKPKPYPDMAELFCRRFEFSNSELLIVGDSTSDMLFAENAGAAFAGIIADYNKFPVRSKTQCRFVSSVSEIIDAFLL